MFRTLSKRLGVAVHQASRQTLPISVVGVRHESAATPAKPPEINLDNLKPYDKTARRLIAQFNDPATDGWKLRGYGNDIGTGDGIPEPEVLIAALHCCRRNNEITCAIRLLEFTRWKSSSLKGAWEYIQQEIEPTMKELGIPTLEQLGYDKPELAYPNVDEM